MTFESKKDHTVHPPEASEQASARRRLAAAFIQDAQRIENSLRTRADLAFDAVYLCALACLGLAADGYEHPSPDVVKKAAGFLGLTAVQIQPAITYARRRYEPLATDEQSQLAYKELLALAKRVLKTK